MNLSLCNFYPPVNFLCLWSKCSPYRFVLECPRELKVFLTTSQNIPQLFTSAAELRCPALCWMFCTNMATSWV